MPTGVSARSIGNLGKKEPDAWTGIKRHVGEAERKGERFDGENVGHSRGGDGGVGDCARENLECEGELMQTAKGAQASEVSQGKGLILEEIWEEGMRTSRRDV